MKTILKQMMPALAALLLAAASGSAQVLTSIYSFANTNGIPPNPLAGLLLSGSTLYGTTSASSGSAKTGGASASGIVFKVNTDGTGYTNLHVFSAVYSGPYSITNTDGGDSQAQLVLSGNRLYGTTVKGGFNASGIVFAINSDGTGFTNLYNFGANGSDVVETNSDGTDPWAGLVLSGNTLYGATGDGGSFGGGTVFAIHTDGTGFTNLYNFSFNNSNVINSDGLGAKSSLVLSNGILYGTAKSGGSAANGTVFAIHTDGTGVTNLHSFSSLVHETNSPYANTNSDGAIPSDLVLSGNVLYGTAKNGGSFAYGTVFAVTTDGTGFTNLHSFNSGEGLHPVTGLVLSGNTLYGTTYMGGSLTAQQSGTVFAVNTDGTGFATIHTFTPTTDDNPLTSVYTNADGSTPESSMILSGNTLYGTTLSGGTNGLGTVFALNLAAAPPSIQFTASPTNGVPPLTVQFNSGGNAIGGWNWNFGDGTTNSTAQNPSHVYTNAGTFFPTLACVNNNGDPATGSGPAIIAAYPTTVLNGGFETGTFTNWTQSGDYYNSGVATGKYAHSGKYGAALAAGGTMGFLSQTLTTTPGAAYLISFWLDSTGATKPNDFQVSWNGNAILDKTNLTAIGWTNIQLTVTATATNTTLQFGYLNNGSFYFGLDDVSVTSGGPAQPQPQIASFSVTGTNLVLSGGGALPGQSFFVLMSTNLLRPISQWTPVATNTPDSSGNFNITATNAVDPKAPQRFYILQLQ
jgi:uncharacterized repeat protein (TIGR03803 family)